MFFRWFSFRHSSRILWFALVVLCFAVGASGCSCQVVGLNVPETSKEQNSDGQKQGNGTTTPPPTGTTTPPPTGTITPPPIVDITNSPEKYQVQGVAVLTFYPKEKTAMEGSFGGYLLVYDKPQETNVQFASLKDGECKFSEFKRPESPKEAPFRGLDVGKSISVGLSGQSWNWEKSPLQWGGKEVGAYYPGSVERLRYAYEGETTLRSGGGPDVDKFSLSWKAPARLTVQKPTLNFQGPTRLKRDSDLPLQWKFEGKAPYLAVRINQSDADNKTVRSLTCRYKPDASGFIPQSYLSKFKLDLQGERTYMFFFAGRYLLAKLPKFKKPLFVVMEAISSSPVVFE